MKKIRAVINMTLDGFCDHTLIVPDDETHQHYNDLLKETGELLYGRTTYQLMEDYWPLLAANPSGNKVEDEFAVLMDNIPKVVFSRTLKEVPWNNSRLAAGSLEEEINALKQQPGLPAFIGSPGLIAQAANLKLIDEYQLMVHPVIAGKGLPLFRDIQDRIDLKLLKTKTFTGGAVILYYGRA